MRSNAINRASAAWILGAALAAFNAAAEVPIRVTADRVNIRARPGDSYEVVTQAGFRDILQAKALGDEWVEIAPPEGVRVWVHQDYVSEGRVSARRLNMRCGPGINYSAVGQLERNDEVSPVETFEDWLALEAPPQCSFWISRAFVEPVAAEPPPVEVAAPPPSPPPAVAPPEAAPPRFPPRDLRLLQGLHLVPQPEQGRPVERTGIIAPVGYLLGRPSRYRLADGRTRELETICYLIGEDGEFQRLNQRSARVVGREYVVREAHHPVLIVDQIDVR